MERVLPSKIEAVILYNDYAGFGPRELLPLINEIAGKRQHDFIRTQLENSPSFLNFSSNGLMIEITHAETPLSQEGFDSTLSSGYTQLAFPEAERMVQCHSKYVFFSIMHCGISQNDPDGHLPPQTPAGPFSEDQFALSVEILKSLLLIYSSRTKPLAIHWMQSNKLLDLKQFANLALDPKDISLLVHPSFFSPGDDEQGRQLVGLRTYGATALIGKEIVFEEAAVEAEVLFERCLQFILRTQGTGWYIPDGDTFGTDETESIRVRHIDDEHEENGVLQLTYERSEAFGFDFSDQEEADGDSEPVDMDDPVERALQEKVAALKASEKEMHLIGEEDDMDSEEEARPELEPWTGSTKKADMSALRALARSSSDVEEIEPVVEKRQPQTMSDIAKSLEGGVQPQVINAPAMTTPEELGEGMMPTPPMAEEKPRKERKKLLGKVSGLFSKNK